VPSKSKAKARRGAESPIKPFYWLLGIIGLAGVGLIAFTVLKGGQAASEPVELPPEAVKNLNDLVQTAKGVKKGPDNAPVRLLIFSDFSCPACMNFTTRIEPSLRKDFIDTGKIQFVYYDFPLGGPGEHKWGFLAARAARCAGDQDKYWEYHDTLFGRQSDWMFERATPTKKLTDYAVTVGVDAGAFKSCLNSDKYADVVTANKELGNQLGVGATPTLYMNQRQVAEWGDYQLLKARIERELGIPATTSAQ